MSMFTGWHDRTKRSPAQYRGVITTAQIAWELEALLRIYDELAPRYVLEIGSQLGGTLYHWLETLEPGAVICNIDILQNTTAEQKLNLPVQWATWPPEGVVLHSLIGRSDDPAIFAAVTKYMPHIDFLFIDALHTYEGAKQDFERYGPLVRQGGIIALHDLMTPEFSPHIQVGKLWREIQAAGYKTQELRAADGAAFGGIGLVYV